MAKEPTMYVKGKIIHSESLLVRTTLLFSFCGLCKGKYEGFSVINERGEPSRNTSKLINMRSSKVEKLCANYLSVSIKSLIITVEDTINF